MGISSSIVDSLKNNQWGWRFQSQNFDIFPNADESSMYLSNWDDSSGYISHRGDFLANFCSGDWVSSKNLASIGTNFHNFFMLLQNKDLERNNFSVFILS